MSRTKGALNKHHKQIVLKRKRGRPKKDLAPPIELPAQLSTLKTKKFLGYCNKCKGMISKGDTVSKFIFECPGCGKRDRITTLKKDMGMEKKYANAKDFLEASVNTQYHDMPAMHDKGIDPKHLKVID